MKTYKEMTQCVLAARDAYLLKQQRQRKILMRCIPAAAAACLMLIAGFGLKHRSTVPIPSVPQITEQTAAPESDRTDTAQTTAAQTVSEPEQTEAKTGMQTTITGEAMPDDPEISTETAVTAGQPVTEPNPTETQAEAAQPVTTEQPSGVIPIAETSVPDGDTQATGTNPAPLLWDDMTICQQFNMAELGTPPVCYMSIDREAPADAVGARIETVYMSGYDFASDTYHHCKAGAYRLREISETEMIAVQFENDTRFYLYAIATAETQTVDTNQKE